MGGDQTPTQPSIGNEKNAMCYTSRLILCLILSRVSSYKPYFFTISFDDCQNLQWRFGLVWLWRQNGLMCWGCLLELVRLSGVTNLSNVLKYIHVDCISAYKWFLSLKTGIKTNKILCIDKWRPPNHESCQEAWTVALEYEWKQSWSMKTSNIPSHPCLIPQNHCIQAEGNSELGTDIDEA